jgi:hypothetical protein
VDQFITIVKPAIDAAAPFVQQAVDAALQAASPIASDVAYQADNALKNAGVDTQTVVYAAKVFYMNPLVLCNDRNYNHNEAVTGTHTWVELDCLRTGL